MQPKFKLPDYSRASVTQPTFKPFQTTQQTTSQSGGFTGLKPFGYVEPQTTKTDVEVDAQIKSLQSQVANLEERLQSVGAGEQVDSRNWFEKITNLPEGQVWWMDVFDIIDRPLQALKYGTSEGSLNEAWQAFAGNREYMTGVDWLSDLGLVEESNLNDTAKLILNLSVDIFADPLNYIAPVKILKKLGILSDVKVVSRMEDTFQTVRRGGIVKASDDIVATATARIKTKLNLADDIDIIKNFDSFDDATKRIIMDDLATEGVFMPAKMDEYARIYGQTIDPATGRIKYLDAPEDLAKMLDDATAAVARSVDELAQISGKVYKRTGSAIKNAVKQADAGRAQLTQLAEAYARANGVTLENARIALFAQGGEYTQIANRVTDLENGVEALRTAEASLAEAKELNKVKVAGSSGERTAGEQIREYFQNAIDDATGQPDDIFGNMEVVVGKTRDNLNPDVMLFYKNKDGVYVRMQKAFEIKDATKGKFSALNTTMRIIDGNAIDNAKKAYQAFEEGTEQYLTAYNEYLRMVQVYQDAGKVPVFDLVPGSKFRDLGEEGLQKFNKNLTKLQNTLNKKGVSFTEYTEAMTKYFNKIDELLEAKGKTWSKLTAAEKAEIRKLADAAMDNPNMTRTFDVMADDFTEMFHRDMLQSEIAKNPDMLYGVINPDGKLVLLTGDDFMSVTKTHSVSVQSVTAKGRPQTQMFFYRTLDNAAVGEVATRNNLFMKSLKDDLLGATEEVVTGQRLVQETVVRKGLIVKMLNGIEKANIPFISPSITLVKKLGEGISFAFNATKGLEDEFAQSVAKLSAEGQVIAKNSVERFEYIVEDIIKRTKGVYKAEDVRRFVTNILESGWDGVDTAGRSISITALSQRVLAQFKKTGKVILPKFDSPVALQNFIDELARIFAGQGLGPEFFKLTERGKFSLLEFAEGTTFKELEELFGGLTPLVGDTQLTFGKAVLSADELRLARQFNDDITMLYGEQKKIQDVLYTELGYDAIPDDVLGTGAYFRHAINPDMLRILKRNSPASIKKFLDAGTDMLRDRMYIGSIDEINAGLKELFNIPIDVFSTNATYNFADLVRVSMNKREMQLVLKEILQGQDTLGKPLFEIVDDVEYSVRGMRGEFKILNNSFKAEFPNLFKNISPEAQETLLKYFADRGFAEGSKVIATHKSAYALLKRLDNAYIQLPEFIKSYDQFMGFWKSFALVTPGYHMRNLFGNMTNSYLAGMSMANQARYLGQSSRDFSYYRQAVRALRRGDDIASLPKNVREAYERLDEFYRIGISQSHKGVKDLEVIKEGIEAAKGQAKRSLPKKALDGLVNVNYHLAESMDDMQRYALYQWALNNSTTSQAYRSAKKVGASVNELKAIQMSEASKKVSEALFDYSHLTHFEKEYMKRLFPFFTFFKNNLIFQAKNIFQRPQQYGKLYRSYLYYTESMTGMDIKDIPDYMSGNLWVPLPMRVDRNDTETITWLKLNLPPTDFTEFLENPFERGVTSVTVPIKLAFELGTGRDVFTGRPISDFPGQVSAYQGEGLFKNLRDESGRLTITQDPVIIKLINDLGLRTTINYASIGVDILDYTQGKQEFDYTSMRILDSLGLTREQNIRDMDIAALYQRLDKLRDEQSLYEQNIGDLPTLKELEEMFGNPNEPKQKRPLFGVFAT